MAENNPANQNTSTTEGNQTDNQNNNQQTAGGTQPSGGEKKYTEEEMNGISKRNSEKAVKKMLKDLGIEDQEKARAILKKAAEEEAAQNASAGNDNVSEQLRTMLAAERAEKERAVLEAVFLAERVDPAKISKAVRLIDLEDCRDDEKKFDRAKAQEAVKALLKEWPELAPKADNSNVGFTIGSDGQQTEGGSSAKNTKAPAQKSWNRFN